MYHLSDIKKVERCEKQYWLSKRKNVSYVPFVNYNENMMELVKEYFMLQDDIFEGKVNDDPSLAMHAIQNYDVLMSARFAYDDIRVKIPLMIKGETGWILYFTYTICHPRENDAKRISDHVCVLEACGITIEDIYAIHLNADYIREEALDVRALFVVTPFLYNAKNHANHTIMKLTQKCKRDIFAFVPQLQLVDQQEEVESIRSTACTRGGKCSYFEDCFPNDQEPSIARLFGSKLDLMKQGIMEIKDVDFALLEGTRLQYAQYMAAQNQGFYMDRFAMKSWVDYAICYPISYLDFEWETYVFPPYPGMKPYDVLTFQYSLHVEEDKQAPLQHFEFLEEGDCRIAFIEQLLQDIPKIGSILVFNMDGAEKLRLKQLAKQFPQYAKQLDAVCERMVDLSLPFSSGNIYDERMEGYYSLKKLVDVFSEFSYHDLAISYGMDAVEAWRSLPTLDVDQKAQTRKELLAYCAMDTFGEVIVFHKILELLERG